MSLPPAAGAVIYAKDRDRVAAFYAAVLGLETVGSDADHVRLASAAFELVVLQIRSRLASTIDSTVPPTRRSGVALKLVFFVPSLPRVREAAAAHGGTLNAVAREWTFNGWKVCDGLDPEGNVIQFRERLPASRPTT